MENKSPIQEFAEFAKQRAELDFTKALIEAVLSSSRPIDKVSTWLFAGIGGTAALIVGNLDKTSVFIGTENIRYVLLFLLIGALRGFAEKYLAVRIQIHLFVSDKAKLATENVLKEHGDMQNQIKELTKHSKENVSAEFDVMKSIQEIEKIVPWYQRWYFRKNLTKSLNDPLHGYRQAARLYNNQVAYAVLELLFAVLSVALVAFNV